MASIVYNNHDFSEYCTAEVIERGSHVVEVETSLIPGRAGLFLEDATLGPMVVKIRLLLALDGAHTASELAKIRRYLRGWLVPPARGAALSLPDDPGLEWHDVVCTDSGNWDALLEDGYVDVEFTCYDPISFGDEVSVAGELSFAVDGTWATWPTIELTADAGSSVEVGCGDSLVRVYQEFAGGETVLIDCEELAVTVDGVDKSAYVSVESEFFKFEPGENTISTGNVSDFTVHFTERWL